MTLPISPEEAARVITDAFSPLRCVAEPFDYDKFVRFRVFDKNDDPLLRMDKVTGTGYGSREGLRSTIGAARSNLMRRGMKLDPWEMPSLGGNR